MEMLQRFYLQRHHKSFSTEESILESNGLYSLDGYLAQYSEQYKIIFENIPTLKRLVVRTEDIDNKIPEITEFIGLKNMQLESVHTNKMQKAEGILSRLPKQFVMAKINQHCGWINKIYWPKQKNF